MFGEGPASAGAAINAQGFNEGKGKPFTAEDIRYTVSKDGKTLYAISMGWPANPVVLKSLGADAVTVSNVELLGVGETVSWTQHAGALVIKGTPSAPDSEARHAAVYKISL